MENQSWLYDKKVLQNSNVWHINLKLKASWKWLYKAIINILNKNMTDHGSQRTVMLHIEYLNSKRDDSMIISWQKNIIKYHLWYDKLKLKT